jgi:hypothetical protein
MSAPKNDKSKAVTKMTTKDSEEDLGKSTALRGSTEGTLSGP